MNKVPLFHDIDNRIALDKGDSDSAYFTTLTLKLESAPKSRFYFYVKRVKLRV